MVYDPQASRRRPRPTTGEPAPVDALLGAAPESAPVIDDPPPTPAVTPHPADPPSDTVLRNTVVAAIAGALVTALALRHLWKRHRAGRDDDLG